VKVQQIINRILDSRFVRDERGTATIEMLIWTPLFLFLLFLTVDASILYWRHAEMWTAARDVARAVSSGSLDASSQTDLNSFVASRLRTTNSTFTVSAAVNTTSGTVTVNLSRPNSSVTTFTLFQSIFTDLGARVVMRMEPNT
jgi:Flp pilus assembly protein TadG